jgi:hypothetical protein
MPEPRRYTGGCHCGRVRYQVTTDLAGVIECNCSICSRRGHWLTFVPADQFQLLQGQDALTDYQFNTHNIHHTFCSVCGVGAFARGTTRDGAPMAAINVRCLDDLDLATVTTTKFDGKSR